MSESRDNHIGVGLALSSSAFIGVSFIVKKKGLIRSRASGSAAGESQRQDKKKKKKGKQTAKTQQQWAALTEGGFVLQVMAALHT